MHARHLALVSSVKARAAASSLALLAALAVVGPCLRTDGAVHAPPADPFQERVLPFLNTYCVRCHNAKTKNGELDLTRFRGIL